MRFSAKVEYGVRVMADLARHYGAGPLSLTEIAHDEDLPLPYMEQLVGSLRRAGLIASSRGAHGGYSLTCEPASITVGDIVRALEGPIAPMTCASEAASAVICPRENFCTVKVLWSRVRDSIIATLDSTTLADLAPAPVNPHIHTGRGIELKLVEGLKV